jgi:hypothetical protein
MTCPTCAMKSRAVVDFKCVQCCLRFLSTLPADRVPGYISMIGRQTAGIDGHASAVEAAWQSGKIG